MKKILAIILFVMLGAFNLFAQKVQVLDARIFKSTNSTLIKFDADSSYYYLQSNAAAIDTLTSGFIRTDNSGSDIYITGRLINVSGSVNAKIEIGVFRGLGYPDYTGYEWFTMKTFSAAGIFEYLLMTNGDFINKPFQKFKIRVTETTNNQQNKYIINVNMYNR